MSLCNVFWGSHGCDRKYLHANPICMCGNGCSFFHLDTGTVLQKTELRAFLAGGVVGRPSGGFWVDRHDGHVDPPREAVVEHEHRCDAVLHVWKHAADCRQGYWLTCPDHEGTQTRA